MSGILFFIFASCEPLIDHLYTNNITSIGDVSPHHGVSGSDHVDIVFKLNLSKLNLSKHFLPAYFFSTPRQISQVSAVSSTLSTGMSFFMIRTSTMPGVPLKICTLSASISSFLVKNLDVVKKSRGLLMKL